MSADLQRLLDRHVIAGAAPGVVAIIGRAEETEVVTAGVASLGGRPMPAADYLRGHGAPGGSGPASAGAPGS